MRYAALALLTSLMLGARSRPVLAQLAALPRMATWTDPTEHAFTIDVPQGWRIVGGTHRNAPIDARQYITAESPDGTMRVFIDDPNILPRQAPHPAYFQMGWYEGRVVSSPAGPLAIERFRTGAQFAQEYTASHVCRAAQREGQFDMPTETRRMAASIAPVAARAGVTVVPSSGEFIYRCGNRPGYTYAVTVLARTTPQGPQTWAVYKLVGYSADPAHVEVARAVMYEMMSSMAMNAAWEARYEQQIHDVTGAIMEISNRITQAAVQRSREETQRSVEAVRERQSQIDKISAMRDESFKRQQAASDRSRQKWSDVTLGQIHGCDDLGRCSTVSNDADYHWVDRSGNVVAGPSDGSPPGPDYHPFVPDHP